MTDLPPQSQATNTIAGEEPAWHTSTGAASLAQLDSRAEGLTGEEVRQRQERWGPNRVPLRPPPRWWSFVLHQFKSPLIYILLAAAVVSLALQELVDAAFILGVLLLNAVIGAVQEWRADRSSRALEVVLKTRATVLRDGRTIETEAEELVPGDIVWVESGNRVPADLRLLATESLQVDESLLTGESLPVAKDANWIGAEATVVADRRNMSWSGSIIVRGRGRGVVVATGVRSLVGRVAEGVTRAEGGRPPLVERMERFSRAVGVAILLASAVIGAIGVFAQGHSPGEMFLVAVALAVAAIPEGLPIAMTVALTVATRRMLARGVIVRRLTAVEGLGSCTLVASDKTGTLTCNEITARRLTAADGGEWEITGEGYVPRGEVRTTGGSRGDEALLGRCARVAALCNEAWLGEDEEGWRWRGDPTDVALLVFAQKCGLSREAALAAAPELARIPFEPERKFAASFHQEGDRRFVAVKGAPETIVEMLAAGFDRLQLDLPIEMARRGYRVLALAEGEVDSSSFGVGSPPRDPEGLELLGFIGLIDPPRPRARHAITASRQAGIGVQMITGDHPVTALAIAHELGLAERDDEVVSGADLGGIEDDELQEIVKRTKVFARVAPQQKLEIVDAARAAGHFVAVTGDGINDGPALRAANIGVAMGRGGTDVAREAADLVIVDDDFATIVAGIEEGRIAYDNIRKVIYFLISTGAAEVVLVGLSLLAGLPLPLLPVQLLWLNLITCGIQDVALAFEPGEEDVLERPPRRPTERIFDRLMIERTLLGAIVMGTVAFGTFGWLLRRGHTELEARNITMLLMVLFENVHIGNCRSETRSLFHTAPWKSPILLTGTLCAVALHVLAMYVPGMQVLLRTAPLSPATWLTLLLLALSLSVAMELHKLSWAVRRR